MNLGYCEGCGETVASDNPVSWGLRHSLTNGLGHTVRTWVDNALPQVWDGDYA